LETFSVSIWPIAAVACTFILAFVLWVRNSSNNKLARMVYQKKVNLFSEDEQRFYRTLQEAVGNEYIIFSRIRISDIISPKRGGATQDTLDEFNVIAAQSFDFILLEPNSFTIVCVIMAQDKTDAGKQDKLQTLCDAAGLPLACFNVNSAYAARKIRERVLQLLQDTPLTFTESYGRIEPHISNMEDIEL
jgi:hypothetical protein